MLQQQHTFQTLMRSLLQPLNCLCDGCTTVREAKDEDVGKTAFTRRAWMTLHVCIAMLAFTRFSYALDAFEIQVYSRDIDAVGTYSLETHFNHIAINQTPPQYTGQLSSDHLTHLTFEFARGMAPWWEVGVYVQTAASPFGGLYFGGAKLRSKFVMPPERAKALHLGVNAEVSIIPHAFEQALWGGEIRPILGTTRGKLTALINPIIDISFGGAVGRAITLAPAAKTFYVVGAHTGLGAEYYLGTAPLANLGSRRMMQQFVFMTYDLVDGPFELNAGLGTGIGSYAPRLVGKVIVGFTWM